MSECITPAPGSRSRVRMYTPARKSAMRRCTFCGVVRRLSGRPRCQFLTRLANITEPYTSSTGMTV